MTCAERPVCPHTDDQADKMLRDTRMAAMTGRTAACWAGGESPQRAIHVGRGEIVWQDRCDAANGSKEPIPTIVAVRSKVRNGDGLDIKPCKIAIAACKVVRRRS
jgi:hypothetical protein